MNDYYIEPADPMYRIFRKKRFHIKASTSLGAAERYVEFFDTPRHCLAKSRTTIEVLVCGASDMQNPKRITVHAWLEAKNPYKVYAHYKAVEDYGDNANQRRRGKSWA